MDLNDSHEQAELRAHARQWLDTHRHEAPPVDGELGDAAYTDRRKAWQRRLVEGRLGGMTWPVQFGGQGRGPIDQMIVDEEIARAGVPGLLDIVGMGLMGPCLMAHGTPEQQERYLAPMLYGDEVWCQLFSEPAAGSDLAAVQTRAVRRDGGGWVINGQKVWTSGAQYSAFGMMLARTDPRVPKHRGLTMFIVPMDAPGVAVHPLRMIAGDTEFNEVFLDDIELTDDAVVGDVGDGWRVALTVLMFERVMLGLNLGGFGFGVDRFASALARDRAACRDAVVRQRFGQLATELIAVRFNGYRTQTALANGRTPGPEGGLVKITAVNAATAAGELIADVIGPDALAHDSEWQRLVSFLPGLKSAGGTESILRNLVGERVLGLPPEPRTDKDVPFSDLRARERELSRA